MNIYDTFVRFLSLMPLLVDGRLKFSSQSRDDAGKMGINHALPDEY